ncbi:sensor histidine kinase [Pseudonocardia halophobica]|uniref:sensor histidine kinase n=1 Tax=Pseudonocardia halophobica TaxID=29401 RepID=UPI003D9054E2
MSALRRPAGVDVVVAAVLAAVLVPVLGSGSPPAATALAVVGTLVDVAALLLVRTSSVTATAAVAIATTVPGLDLGPGVLAWPLLALLVGLHGGNDAVLAAAFTVSVVVSGRWHPAYSTVDFVATILLVTLLFWALGRLRRTARERDERRHAAAEQARQAELVSAERRRIADELGAVVLADLRRLVELTTAVRPAAAAGAAEPVLAELRQVARRALAAMRRVVTVLRSAEIEPAPVPADPRRRWWEPRPPSTSGLLLVVVGGVTMVLVAGLDLQPGGRPELDPLLPTLGLPVDRPVLLWLLAVQVAAVAWWRTTPVPALVVATAADVVLRLAGAANAIAQLGGFVLAYRVGVAVPVRVSAPVVVAVAAATTAAHLLGDEPPSGGPPAVDAALTAAGPLVLWGVGVLVRHTGERRRRRRADESARRSRTNLADERLRIARELHDLVAHHVSAVAVQTSAARTGPAALATALGHIEEGGRRIAEAVETLSDLTPPAVRNAPLTGAVVEELVVPVQAAGLPVTVRVDGEPAPDQGEADLFARRIVVEALTNVLRHAGASPTSVTVQHGPDEVAVEVRDSGVLPGHVPATAGTGLGLVGMRERTALLGGEVEAGPAGHGWIVRARLPRLHAPR